MLGVWLNWLWKPTSSKPSRMSAMSPSRTTDPSRPLTTSMSANSSAHCLRALTRSRISPALVCTAPAAKS